MQANSILPARRFQMSPEGKLCNVEQIPVAIEKGSLVIIDIFGLHMNRKSPGVKYTQFV